MQPIERYGVIALIFLVITVVAVVFWDQRPTSGEVKAQVKDGAVALKEKAHQLKDGAGDLVNLRAETPKRTPQGRTPGGRALGKNEPTPAQLEKLAQAHRGGDEIPPGLLAVAKREAEERAKLQGAGAIPSQPAPSSHEVRNPAPVAARPVQPAPVVSTPRVESKPARGGQGPLYTVQKGDTLSEIAMNQLGTMKRWQEIVALNPGLDAGRLRVGARLVMPADARGGAAPAPSGAKPGAKSAGQPAAGATYEVREADSLWKIAARQLGDGERWREIAQLNPTIDPDRLSVGQKLVLPKGARPAAARPAERLVASATPDSTPSGGRRGRVQ